jgi:hypothetical protein
MQYLRCSCGKAEAWSSGFAFADCQGCSECGTNYNRTALQPHEIEEEVTTNTRTGETRTRRWCRRCYQTVRSETADAR